VLELASPHARIIDVGRRCANLEPPLGPASTRLPGDLARKVLFEHSALEHRGTSIELAIALLLREAKSGARVVRLHAGDPCVFGRGGEEIDALALAEIAYELVPGVSAVHAAPAAAGIPLTRRGEARGYTVRTGHDKHGWTEGQLPKDEETIVVLM